MSTQVAYMIIVVVIVIKRTTIRQAKHPVSYPVPCRAVPCRNDRYRETLSNVNSVQQILKRANIPNAKAKTHQAAGNVATRRGMVSEATKVSVHALFTPSCDVSNAESQGDGILGNARLLRGRLLRRLGLLKKEFYMNLSLLTQGESCNQSLCKPN